jgi:hypothetical protein
MQEECIWHCGGTISGEYFTIVWLLGQLTVGSTGQQSSTQHHNTHSCMAHHWQAMRAHD